MKNLASLFWAIVISSCATYPAEKNAASEFVPSFTVGHSAVNVRPDFDWRESKYKALDHASRAKVMEKVAIKEATKYCESEKKLFKSQGGAPLAFAYSKPEFMPTGFELKFSCE